MNENRERGKAMARSKKSKKTKHQIAVRMCAGCCCRFERRKVLQSLVDAFAESCGFEYMYEKDQEKNYDLMLMINGCDSECSKPSEVIDNLVIDHNNWENAIEVFAEKTGW